MKRRARTISRTCLYHPRTEEGWEAADYGNKRGHTDLGSVTLLFTNRSWAYKSCLPTSAQPGTVTVNLAEGTIPHLTGGWLKSSKINATYKRTGLPYFARPHNKTILVPITESLVLEQAGFKPRFEEEGTMEQWVKAKQTLQPNPGIAAKRWAETGDGNIRGACRLFRQEVQGVIIAAKHS
ncbi:hypothetical protein CLCR_07648 [Cladophialophora carrionii]|uniref:Uncharacterized protein n=1 Tax=Cladophialophora carrionii TaxID=86049 RepID=A0A1C1CPJ9_9EURO|nr:hypothetical protein CLCR_07648 [Cladophialophora carrionii]